MTPTLVDAGPLVGLSSSRDQFHQVCTNELRRLTPPLLTTWPVLAEAAWILRDEPVALPRLLELGEAGVYNIVPIGQDSLPWLKDFLIRYHNIRAQLADATLVLVAEQVNSNRIFTLDRRDFSVFRFGRKRSFRILPEP